MVTPTIVTPIGAKVILRLKPISFNAGQMQTNAAYWWHLMYKLHIIYFAELLESKGGRGGANARLFDVTG